MDKYQLSKSTELDLDDLYAEGILKYGLLKADNYYDGLIGGFGLLANNPNIGTNANKLSPNLQKFPYGRHVVFFTNLDKGILIVRVLGKEMNFEQHLPSISPL